jgi:hypothetical protein
VIRKGDVLKKFETMEGMTPMTSTMAISSSQGPVNAGIPTPFWTIENRHNRTFKIPYMGIQNLLAGTQLTETDLISTVVNGSTYIKIIPRLTKRQIPVA